MMPCRSAADGSLDDAALAFTVGVPASAAEPDLAGTLASVHASAARAGGTYEIIVAVNGGPVVGAPGGDDQSPAVRGVRAFAGAAGIALLERGAVNAASTADAEATTAARAPVVRVLRLTVQSKVAAWNAIHAAARAPIVVFTDADVRLAPDAISRLLAHLAATPSIVAAAGREAPALAPGDGLVARVAALPYRFDFGNVPGRLYALRVAGHPEPMPAHVLHEDAYLSARLGRARFAKVADAVVYLRPPTTWREYLRQRVRNELGKLQLEDEFPDLLRAHGFGVYPWRAFVRDIRPREYPLVALSLAARAYARLSARRRSRDGFDRGWSALPSTKSWVPGSDAVPREP